ncbi:2175_t:CDS:2 [Paraglomus occultum]|uniref:2175_t:CDS:1 n=1 Tax=Paraglomus occultum TaxID=144539 RepID=A0A9N8Z6J1_9GLOM|nr:2175_t:CDS:2 [Paraglomus occultum]
MPAERSQYRKNVRPNQQNTVTNNGLQLQSPRFNKRSKNLGAESVIYGEPSRISVFDRLGTTGARDSPLDIPRLRWRRPSESYEEDAEVNKHGRDISPTDSGRAERSSSVGQASSRHQQAEETRPNQFEGQFRRTSGEPLSNNDDEFQASDRDRTTQAKLDVDDVKEEDFTKRSRSRSPVNSVNYEDDQRLKIWDRESEKNEAKEKNNNDNIGRNIIKNWDQSTAQPLNGEIDNVYRQEENNNDEFAGSQKDRTTDNNSEELRHRGDSGRSSVSVGNRDSSRHPQKYQDRANDDRTNNLPSFSNDRSPNGPRDKSEERSPGYRGGRDNSKNDSKYRNTDVRGRQKHLSHTPEDSISYPWRKCFSERHRKPYYYNEITHESRWNIPLEDMTRTHARSLSKSENHSVSASIQDYSGRSVGRRPTEDDISTGVKKRHRPDEIDMIEPTSSQRRREPINRRRSALEDDELISGSEGINKRVGPNVDRGRLECRDMVRRSSTSFDIERDHLDAGDSDLSIKRPRSTTYPYHPSSSLSESSETNLHLHGPSQRQSNRFVSDRRSNYVRQNDLIGHRSVTRGRILDVTGDDRVDGLGSIQGQYGSGRIDNSYGRRASHSIQHDIGGIRNRMEYDDRGGSSGYASRRDSNSYSRRDPSPYGRRDPSPYGRREPSPYGRREPSPYGRREPSPYGRRELSPYGRRDRSPFRRRDSSPFRRRDPSPYGRRDFVPYGRRTSTSSQLDSPINRSQTSLRPRPSDRVDHSIPASSSRKHHQADVSSYDSRAKFSNRNTHGLNLASSHNYDKPSEEVTIKDVSNDDTPPGENNDDAHGTPLLLPKSPSRSPFFKRRARETVADQIAPVACFFTKGRY